MKLIVLPTLVALLAQFGSLPFLIGARGGGEALGWVLVMAIFFGIPSGLVYLVMFTGIRATTPPTWLAVGLGVIVPATVVLGVGLVARRTFDLSAANWVLWMGIIGGVAGALTYVHLSSATTAAA